MKKLITGLVAITVGGCLSFSGCQSIDLIKQEAENIKKNPEKVRKIFNLAPEDSYDLLGFGTDNFKVIIRDKKYVSTITYGDSNSDGIYEKRTLKFPKNFNLKILPAPEKQDPNVPEKKKKVSNLWAYLR